VDCYVLQETMTTVLSHNAKPTKIQWLTFISTALIHYAALCTYFYLWAKMNRETPVSAVVFFIGLAAWIFQIGSFLYFRKRSPVIARLSLIVFISSLLFGLLFTSPTD